MNKLEEMHEDDPFLEHLESLKEHPGWLAYQAWVQRQHDRAMKALKDPMTAYDGTCILRGGIVAYELCQKGLQILINEHSEKIKEVRK